MRTVARTIVMRTTRKCIPQYTIYCNCNSEGHSDIIYASSTYGNRSNVCPPLISTHREEVTSQNEQIKNVHEQKINKPGERKKGRRDLRKPSHRKS